jgi:hypothetical protein
VNPGGHHYPAREASPRRSKGRQGGMPVIDLERFRWGFVGGYMMRGFEVNLSPCLLGALDLSVIPGIISFVVAFFSSAAVAHS